MQYEHVTGAPAVETLLRHIADGVSVGELRIDSMTILPLPAVAATLSVEDESEENLATIVVRLTHFWRTSGPVAVERGLSHPGD